MADRPGHDRRYALDTTKLKSLGWQPEVPFDRGLADDRRVVPAQRMVVAADQGDTMRRFAPYYASQYGNRSGA